MQIGQPPETCAAATLGLRDDMGNVWMADTPREALAMAPALVAIACRPRCRVLTTGYGLGLFVRAARRFGAAEVVAVERDRQVAAAATCPVVIGDADDDVAVPGLFDVIWLDHWLDPPDVVTATTAEARWRKALCPRGWLGTWGVRSWEEALASLEAALQRDVRV